jgi:hypothetical protein
MEPKTLTDTGTHTVRVDPLDSITGAAPQMVLGVLTGWLDRREREVIT